MLFHFIKTSIDFVQSPFHFDSQDFLMTGIITGVTALSFTLDNSIRKECKERCIAHLWITSQVLVKNLEPDHTLWL